MNQPYYKFKVTENQWHILSRALELYGNLATDADDHFADIASNLVLEDLGNQANKEWQLANVGDNE